MTHSLDDFLTLRLPIAGVVLWPAMGAMDATTGTSADCDAGSPGGSAETIVASPLSSDTSALCGGAETAARIAAMKSAAVE